MPILSPQLNWAHSVDIWVRWSAKPQYRIFNTNMLEKGYCDWWQLNEPKPDALTLKNPQVAKAGNAYPQPRWWCHPRGFRASYDPIMITSWCTQVENSYLKRYASKTLSKSSFEHDDISGKKKNLINLNGEDWPQISSPCLLTTTNYNPITLHAPHTCLTPVLKCVSAKY